MGGRNLLFGAGVALALAAGACSETREMVAPTRVALASRADRSQPAPAPLTTVTIGGKSLTFWPYTGDNFSGTPVDPISLLFPGRGDPRQLRAVLLTLNGDRTAAGLPNVAPFNCVWKDAAGGGNQTAYAQGAGWVGSVIQLTCGDYGIRYHLRLFPAGDWTLASAHFEVNIPGTQEHQPLSWERAAQLVVFDFYRSRLLAAAPAEVNAGSESPTFRTIIPQVWFPLAAAQPALAAYADPVVVEPNDVRIRNSGMATVLTLASTPAVAPLDETTEFAITMGQIIPRPFCGSGPYDYVYVSGELRVSEHTVVSGSGSYHNRQEMKGALDVTPVNPLTGQPSGETFKAMIDNVNTSLLTDEQSAITLYTRQSTSPAGPGRGVQTESLRLGPGNSTGYDKTTRCD